MQYSVPLQNDFYREIQVENNLACSSFLCCTATAFISSNLREEKKRKRRITNRGCVKVLRRFVIHGTITVAYSQSVSTEIQFRLLSRGRAVQLRNKLESSLVAVWLEYFSVCF